MYCIALKKDDGYTIIPEYFGVRSNAENFAKRMGWKDFSVVTGKQREMIERRNESVNSPVLPAIKSSSPPPEDLFPSGDDTIPDANWMKTEGIPWNKSRRSNKRKAKKK